VDKVLATKIILGVIVGLVCILVLLIIYRYADFGINRSEKVPSQGTVITCECTKFYSN